MTKIESIHQPNLAQSGHKSVADPESNKRGRRGFATRFFG